MSLYEDIYPCIVINLYIRSQIITKSAFKDIEDHTTNPITLDIISSVIGFCFIRRSYLFSLLHLCKRNLWSLYKPLPCRCFWLRMLRI